MVPIESQCYGECPEQKKFEKMGYGIIGRGYGRNGLREKQAVEIGVVPIDSEF